MPRTTPLIDRGRPVTAGAFAGPRRSRRRRGRAGGVLGFGLGLLLAAGGAVVTTPRAASAQPPGAEIFTKTPTTPLEFWDAADYLIRTGQSPAAVPYLNKFLAAKPDDATLLMVRDRYGPGSILRLQDHPATRGMVDPLLARVAEASHRHATRPDRIAYFVAALTKTREEQDYAVERLREAGAYAVPPVVAELQKSASPDERAMLARSLGRLDASAVPPLIAMLDASDTRLASEAADALARIGDVRAVPALTLVASGKTAAAEAAARAVGTLTGRPFAAQRKAPARLLLDEARRYYSHQVRFPGDPVVVWAWDNEAKAPVPKTLSASEAEAQLGQKFARAALALAPNDLQAQALSVGLTLEKAIERTGFENFPAGDTTDAMAVAKSAGPVVLGEVLRSALAEGKTDLAAVAASALGQATDANSLSGGPSPLVEALSAPGRRARFAAAKALVSLAPKRAFPGSSRVVPVLAQFLSSREAPRAVVIDGNLTRGGNLAGYLKALGYDPTNVPSGDEGFRLAAESADVELVLIDHSLLMGPWKLHDTLANLRADARTAGLPVFVVGPLIRHTDLASLNERFPGVRFLVTPTNSEGLGRQLNYGVGRPKPLPAAERARYAREAAALLAQVASKPGSPFASDLAAVEPALTAALNVPDTGLSASEALGGVGVPDAQRGLADALIDPARRTPLRVGAASRLTRSIQRFGPLVAADQEAKLQAAFNNANDPALRDALNAVVAALRSKSEPAIGPLRPATSNHSPEPDASASPGAVPASPR